MIDSVADFDDRHAMPAVVSRQIEIPGDAIGQRLDRALTHLLPALSRSSIQRSILSGDILVNGKPAKPSLLLEVGQEVSFISSGEKRYTKEVDISLALENFALRIGSAMHDSALRQNGKINQAYHALSLSPLLNSKYANAINNIAEHMGYKSGAIAFDDRRITPARILDCISKTASLLNFGEPSIKDRKKIDIKFSFSPELSRKEYIDLSLSFMNGIVRRADTKREIYSTIENRGSRYVLHIKERN